MRKYIQIDLTEGLHFRLKRATSSNGKTIKGALLELIEQYIQESEKNPMGSPFID